MPTALRAPETVAAYIAGVANFLANQRCRKPSMTSNIAREMCGSRDMWAFTVYYLGRIASVPYDPRAHAGTPVENVNVVMTLGPGGPPIHEPCEWQERYARMMSALIVCDQDAAWSAVFGVYDELPDERHRFLLSTMEAAHAVLHS